MARGPAIPEPICCLDLDTFFVSVERLFDPSLTGKPVIVGGDPGRRGVVTAASYEVRALGVRSGMSLGEAARKAPGAIFLPTRHGVYSDYSRQVRSILDRFCPEVQPASIDEFYLDFSGCGRLLFRTGDKDPGEGLERTIREMREAIQDELGLPASVGIGSGRAIAKIASGLAKPAGVLRVFRGGEAAFLRPLLIRKFPGIGPVTERKLQIGGMFTLGDLLDCPPGPTLSCFQGVIHPVRSAVNAADGQASAPRRPSFVEHDPEGEDAGSISNERTFAQDRSDPRAVEAQVLSLVERVCWRARQRGIQARTITLKLRYSDFQTLTRSRTILATSCEGHVAACIRPMLREALRRTLPIRLVGVGLSGLVPAEAQLELPYGRISASDAGRAMDGVRERFGYDAIHLGASDRIGRWQE